MRNSKRFFAFLLILNFLLLTGFIKNPPNDESLQQSAEFSVSFNEFIKFSKSLTPTSSTNPDDVYGLFVPEKFSFEVEQQPYGHPEYVSNKPDHLTQFSLVSAKNSFALLAHNHLAGSNFSKLTIGDFMITLDQAGTHVYQITQIENYQALSPNSPYSNFLSLDGSNQKLSATQLFSKIYNQENHLVLQTCLEKDGELSWGRTFIIAEELTEINVADYFSFEQSDVFVKN